jgi:chemotaxis signal transduction protein
MPFNTQLPNGPASNSMLLLCQVNSQYYGLPTAAVAAVVPWVDLLSLPTQTPGLVGGLTYGAELLPVLDLGLLLGKSACAAHFSSRIAVIEVAPAALPPSVPASLGADAPSRQRPGWQSLQTQRFGLRAAGMTSLLDAQDYQPLDTAMLGQDSPYLGPPLRGEMGLVQPLELAQIAARLTSTALAVSP